MKKLFTLIGALLLWQSMAVAQNFLHISSGDSAKLVVRTADLDSVTVRDANFYKGAWAYYSEGVYTFNVYWSGQDGYSIYRRDVNDDGQQWQYQVRGWYPGNPLVIDYDASTNQCCVQPQYIGYVHSSYGDMYVADVEYYRENINPNCKADPGVSTFDPNTGLFELYVVYYVSAGYFGAGYEYLQLDAQAAPARKREVKNGKLELETLPLTLTSKATGKRVPLTISKPTGNLGSEQLKMMPENDVVE